MGDRDSHFTFWGDTLDVFGPIFNTRKAFVLKFED